MYSAAREFSDEMDGFDDMEPMIEKAILGAHERRIVRLEEGFGSIVQTVTKIEADVRQTNVLASDLCRVYANVGWKLKAMAQGYRPSKPSSVGMLIPLSIRTGSV